MQTTKRPNDDSHEADERREQREVPVHRLEYSIEEQCHSDIARARGEAGCGTQPAANEEGNSTRQEDEQIKGTGNPRLETRRRFCTPFHHFTCAHIFFLHMYATIRNPGFKCGCHERLGPQAVLARLRYRTQSPHVTRSFSRAPLTPPYPSPAAASKLSYEQAQERVSHPFPILHLAVLVSEALLDRCAVVT